MTEGGRIWGPENSALAPRPKGGLSFRQELWTPGSPEPPIDASFSPSTPGLAGIFGLWELGLCLLPSWRRCPLLLGERREEGSMDEGAGRCMM